MRMRKYNLILILALICMVVHTNAQDVVSKRTAIINGFMNALFNEKKDAAFIVAEFMTLAPNKDFPMDKRITTIQHLLDTLKSNKFLQKDLTNYKVISYDDYDKQKALFSDDQDKILVLDIGGKPVVYFYFNEAKITSFYWIKKGKYAFFIVV